MRRQPPKTPRPLPVPRVPSPLADLDPDSVTAFWDGPGSVQPLVERVAAGRIRVTFCWRDAHADGVLLFANRLTDETSLADTLLERLGDSDLWHASFEMADDWRASYAFLVQPAGAPEPWRSGDQVQIRQVLDHGHRDPRNPVQCQNRAGVVQSVVELPAAPAQPWTARRAGTPAGTVRATRARDGRQVWWYDPPGIDLDAELPLLVMLDGEVWTEPTHSLPIMADNLIADGAVRPFRALLPESGGRDLRWQELAADGSGVSDVVERWLPWARSVRGVAHGPENVAVCGQSLGGITALRTGLLHPDLVGQVISHSASLWQDDLTALVRGRPGTASPRIHLAHGSQEWVLTAPHRTLAQALRGAGIAVHEAVHNGGHDYAWWRGGVADALRETWGPA